MVIQIGLGQLTVAGSIVIVNSTTIQLDGDVLAPGNNYVYSTNGAGSKGWNLLSGLGVTSVAGTSGEVLVNGGTSAVTGAAVLSLPSSLTSIDNITASALTSLVLTAGSNGASLSLGYGAGGKLTIDSGLFKISTTEFGNVGSFTFGENTAQNMNSYIWIGRPAITSVANQAFYEFHVENNGAVTIQAATTSVVVATVGIHEPNITLGAGAVVPDAATLYMGSAPTEGVRNSAIYVANDLEVRFDGYFEVNNVGTRATYAKYGNSAKWYMYEDSSSYFTTATAHGGSGIAANATTFYALAAGTQAIISTATTTTVTGYLDVSNVAVAATYAKFGSAAKWYMFEDSSSWFTTATAHGGSGLAANATTAYLIVAGSPAVTTTAAVTTIAAATASTSTTTGALVVTGGMGIVGNVISGGGVGWGVTSTVTAAGTTTLTVASTTVQIFTGLTSQTIQLPAATVMGSGVSIVYHVVNKSSAGISVKAAGSDLIEGINTYNLMAGGRISIVGDGVNAWSII